MDKNHTRLLTGVLNGRCKWRETPCSRTRRPNTIKQSIPSKLTDPRVVHELNTVTSNYTKE